MSILIQTYDPAKEEMMSQKEQLLINIGWCFSMHVSLAETKYCLVSSYEKDIVQLFWMTDWKIYVITM